MSIPSSLLLLSSNTSRLGRNSRARSCTTHMVEIKSALAGCRPARGVLPRIVVSFPSSDLSKESSACEKSCINAITHNKGSGFENGSANMRCSCETSRRPGLNHSPRDIALAQMSSKQRFLLHVWQSVGKMHTIAAFIIGSNIQQINATVASPFGDPRRWKAP